MNRQHLNVLWMVWKSTVVVERMVNTLHPIYLMEIIPLQWLQRIIWETREDPKLSRGQQVGGCFGDLLVPSCRFHLICWCIYLPSNFADTQPPVLTWTSNTPTQTNNPSQRITWDSSETATFKCTLNGRKFNCGRGTDGEYTTPNLPDGNHTFTVIPVDDLRNRGRPQVVTWSTGRGIFWRFASYFMSVSFHSLMYQFAIKTSHKVC